MDGLRRQDNDLLNKEIKFMNACSAVVVHNNKMKDKLVSCGLSTKIYVLELFDYIMHDNEMLRKECNYTDLYNKLVYAGNLTKEKSPFLYDFTNSLSDTNIRLNVYGVGINHDISEYISYKGSYNPDVLPNFLDGDLGLIWDGKSTEEDENQSFKAYTKYNNPHKLSCYLAAGLPVISWKKAAIASFIRENDIGYLISNLADIAEIDLCDYDAKRKNAAYIQQKVRDGYYTKRIVKNILQEIH